MGSGKEASRHDPADLDPADLLGRSVHDERVVACLRSHEATEPDTIFEGGSAFYGRSEETGFSLSAEGLESYRERIGEPRSALTGDPSEFIVSRIDFSDAGCASPGSRTYDGPLPFGLQFGDSADAVTGKLGAKPKRKGRSGDLPGRSPVAFVRDYNVDGMVVIVKLTAELRLAAVYLAPIDRHERQSSERKASLKAMSGTIDPGSAGRIEALRASIPTARWREAITEAGTDMAEADIADAERLLHRYIDDIKSAAAKRSAPAIHRTTKRLVVALNTVNRRRGLIETLERDELGAFIDAVVAATGFTPKEGEDITMPWREW